ncbi:MAG: hypothetical protein ACOC85_01635 [Thermoplasmatota archaeon]
MNKEEITVGQDKKEKIIGQSSGLVVFIIGILLLLFTFYLAYNIFMDPTSLERFLEVVPEAQEEMLGDLFGMIIYFVAVALLFAMGVIAGMIAKHGIGMFRPSQYNTFEFQTLGELSGTSVGKEIESRLNKMDRMLKKQHKMIKEMSSEKETPIETTKEIKETSEESDKTY